MLAFAETQFELNTRLEDGSTERQNLESAAAQGNPLAIERLAGAPPMPEGLGYLWAYFHELDATRRNYGWGVTRIEFAEIDAWTRLYNLTLDNWELNAILRLDALYVQTMSKANKGK